MTTVMVVEDDPAFLTRFCRIVASDPELELFAAVGDLASARQAMSKATPDVFWNPHRNSMVSLVPLLIA